MSLQSEAGVFKFHVITQITVWEATMFYQTVGRFPTNKEIDLIIKVGVEKICELHCLSRTLSSDFEKLGKAKQTFVGACKKVLYDYLKFP